MQLTQVAPFSFGSNVTSLNLSHNAITSFSPMNFDNYSFLLQSMDVSYNNLTVLSIELLSTIPGLNRLDAGHNGILAIPMASNHITRQKSMEGNVVTCASFGPEVTGCSCNNGYTLTTHCGYVRCTPTSNGCEARTEYNSSDCSRAPWSSCVSLDDVPQGQYYDVDQQAFRQLTVCATEFVDAKVRPPQPLPAYEFTAPTITSNRQVRTIVA